jgi:3-mercaptopyruvate sulfurtransferase SseA
LEVEDTGRESASDVGSIGCSICVITSIILIFWACLAGTASLLCIGAQAIQGPHIDACPLNEFRGEDDVWLRKGHIPGVISFHWARLMKKDNTHKFKPFNQMKAALEAAGITPDKDIICYCGPSRQGSLLFFQPEHVAGFPKIRLYEGAWNEYVWLQGKSLPAETGGQPAGMP